MAAVPPPTGHQAKLSEAPWGPEVAPRGSAPHGVLSPDVVRHPVPASSDGTVAEPCQDSTGRSPFPMQPTQPSLPAPQASPPTHPLGIHSSTRQVPVGGRPASASGHVQATTGDDARAPWLTPQRLPDPTGMVPDPMKTALPIWPADQPVFLPMLDAPWAHEPMETSTRMAFKERPLMPAPPPPGMQYASSAEAAEPRAAAASAGTAGSGQHAARAPADSLAHEDSESEVLPVPPGQHGSAPASRPAGVAGLEAGAAQADAAGNGKLTFKEIDRESTVLPSLIDESREFVAPSKGSEGHLRKKCRPCHYVSSKSGCANGYDCSFCHCRHSKRSRPRIPRQQATMCKELAQTIFDTMHSSPQPTAAQAEMLPTAAQAEMLIQLQAKPRLAAYSSAVLRSLRGGAVLRQSKGRPDAGENEEGENESREEE